VELTIGYEYEVGLKEDKLPEAKKLFRKLRYQLTYDGSIDAMRNNSEAYELRSKVYTVDTAKPTTIKEIEDDFKAITEFASEANRTMGIHIHVSTKDNKTYKLLKSYKFVDVFQRKYLENFTRDREKRRARNSYCKFVKGEEEYVDNITERYTAVNMASISKHGTVEFRVFPSTRNPLSFNRYLRFVIMSVVNYISYHNRLEEAMSIKV
jgi:hypothetical protein